MKTYIKCNNKAERDAVLKAMDKKGIRWVGGGEMPSKWESDEWEDNDPIYLIVHDDDSLSWGYASFVHDGDRNKMMSASEYLAREKKNPPILIYRKGRAVFAEDKGTEYVGTAICSPDDTFDFYTGAMIAICRLVGDKIGDDARTEMRKLIGEEPSADTDEFKVGDRVEIKTWDEMEKEYGTATWGEISHGDTCFCGTMKHLCGRTATITEIDEDRYFLDFDDKSGDIEWYYTAWMLKKSDKPKPEVTEIKVGDKVTVVNYKKAYDTYAQWFIDNDIDKEIATRYAYKSAPQDGVHYFVKAIAPHGHDPKTILYCIQGDEYNDGLNPAYLISRDGIEKV